MRRRRWQKNGAVVAARSGSRILLQLFLFLLVVGSALSQNQPPYTDLHDFGGKVLNANGKIVPDGIYPATEVVFDKAGDMFGTTYQGGAYGVGIVFEITAAGVYKDLHDFGGKVTIANGTVGQDGMNPSAVPTVDAAGNVYGSTFYGGPHLSSSGGAGMLWKITSTGKYVDLHDFGAILKTPNGSPSPDGANPCASFVTSTDGHLMLGTASSGGPFNAGVLWEITPSTGYYIVHNFGGRLFFFGENGATTTDGVSPNSNIVFDFFGNAYGTCEYGGENLSSEGGGGIIWQLTPEGVYYDWYNFGAPDKNSDGQPFTGGAWPVGPIQIIGPFPGLIGTCSGGGPGANEGGAGAGTFWYNGVDQYLFGGNTTSANGKASLDGAFPTGLTNPVFGTATYGGYYGQDEGGGGMVWQAWSSGREDLHDFGGTIVNANGKKGPDGLNPVAPVSTDPDGNLYGTTQFGGPNDVAKGGDGMIWRILTSLQSFTINPVAVVGGTAVNANIGMAGPAPYGGTFIKLASSSSAATPGPSTVGAGLEATVAGISTIPVALPTPVTITATQGNITKTAKFTIEPPAVSGVIASPNPVIGGATCSGSIRLNGFAPAVGWTVTLSSNSKLLVVPAKVVVSAASSDAPFSITTSTVTTKQTVTISAHSGSTTQTATVTIEPPPIATLSISPSTFVGGSSTPVTGKVTLNEPAPAGGAVVTLTSSLPAAVTVPTSVTIAAGATTASFTVKTFTVISPQFVSVKAAYDKSSDSVSLDVKPS
jgi:uncharacterized repeat protein (TIGR03803 family)